MLPQLQRFDGIIGLDLLKQVGGVVDLKSDQLIMNSGSEKLFFEKCSNVNFSSSCSSPTSDLNRNKISSPYFAIKSVFGDPDESLSFNTNVVVTIRTVDEEPVYTKLYPYPMGVVDFVNEEVKGMLANGIIRPSRSPYNNAVFVVDKKGLDKEGNRKKGLLWIFVN